MSNNIPCRFYSSPGGCRWGNSCWFVHNGTSGASNAPSSYRSNSRYNSSSSSTKSAIPCRFYKLTGGCRNGANCYYAHIGPSGKSVQCKPVPKKEEAPPKPDKKDELTVFGYLRNIEGLLNQDKDKEDSDLESIMNLAEIDSIPRVLYNLCLDFYGIIVKWDMDRRWHNSAKMKVTENGNCITKTKEGWGSAFLTESISSGLHHYKFKIEELDQRRGWFVLFGIWKTNTGQPKLESFFTDLKGNGYALNVIDGTLTDPKLPPGCGGIKYLNKYPPGCSTGDVVEMFVDLDNNGQEMGLLTFAINGTYYAKGAEIEKCEYKCAVSMYWNDESIRFISHDNHNPFIGKEQETK